MCSRLGIRDDRDLCPPKPPWTTTTRQMGLSFAQVSLLCCLNMQRILLAATSFKGVYSSRTACG
ncbi:MAG: hypothetical protein IPH85_14485 [Ignavibacteria bacterium]|nr:hypothetical protein [Ignavibacteria bacterium]MBK7034410.1 hypothetical protein [Ignavibacteria bacterium]MBK7187096.1 hypothetical protein [Ignavibacteria bacterium]MBK7578511.1 hypothetical protein [Ignavibacteria bacterium]